MKNPYGLHDEFACRYQQSIMIFDRDFRSRSEQERTGLLYGIVEHCELARKFEFEREHLSREADREALAEAESAAKHARALANYLGAYPWQATIALMNAILKSEVHLRMHVDQTPMETTSTFEDGCDGGGKPVVAMSPSHSMRLSLLLNRLAEEFEAGNLLAKCGPFAHRTRHGPLGYHKPIDNVAATALPTRETALAIYLSFLFRKYEAERQIFIMNGELYPKNGKPHWKLVNQLVCDTFEMTGDFAEAAKARTKGACKLQMWGYRR